MKAKGTSMIVWGQGGGCPTPISVCRDGAIGGSTECVGEFVSAPTNPDARVLPKQILPKEFTNLWKALISP